MEQMYDNLIFLKRLIEKDLRELIALCALEWDERQKKFQYQMALQENNDIRFSCRNDNGYMYIQASVGGIEHCSLSIIANDYTMRLHNGEIFDDVVLLYLTAKFGNEYSECLVKARLNAALAEKERLLANVQSIYDMKGTEKDKRKLLKKKIFMEIDHIQ